MTTAAAPPADPVRAIGHVGTAVFGLLLAAAGVASFGADLPKVLGVGELIFGAAAIGLAYSSWLGSRIGWAFATTLDGVFAVICLFGAPKIAHLLGVELVVAGLPCVLAAVSCVLLATLGPQYDR
jgi:hypothetical protein